MRIRCIWLTGLSFLLSTTVCVASNDCEVLLMKSDIHKAVVNGETVYLVPQKKLDGSPDMAGCISYTKALKESAKALDDAKNNLKAYQQLNDTFNTRLAEYRKLTDDSMVLNRKYSDISGEYGQQLKGYKDLADELASVSHKFDDLAGEYRSVARSLMRQYRVGAAVSDNKTYMFQVGYRYLNLFYLTQDGDDKVLLGGEINF
jgi:hypothetical protein